MHNQAAIQGNFYAAAMNNGTGLIFQSAAKQVVFSIGGS